MENIYNDANSDANNKDTENMQKRKCNSTSKLINKLHINLCDRQFKITFFYMFLSIC